MMRNQFRIFAAAGVTALLAACLHGSLQSTPPADTAAANRQLVLRFHEALNRQEWTSLDGMVAPGYQHHVVSANGFRTLSWDEFKRGNRGARAAFPDWTATPQHVVAEGDVVSVMLVGRGTHTGSIAGERPTGTEIVLPIAIYHEVKDGRLVGDWEIVNTAPLEKALAAAAESGVPSAK